MKNIDSHYWDLLANKYDLKIVRALPYQATAEANEDRIQRLIQDNPQIQYTSEKKYSLK